MQYPAVVKLILEKGVDNLTIPDNIKFQALTEAASVLVKENKPIEAAKALALANNQSDLIKLGNWYKQRARFREASYCFLHSTNVEEMKSSESINVLRLLGQEGDWGYSDLGVSAEALAQSIAAVGNYGEIYDRYMGPNGASFTLPRGLNNLWNNGGILYAPPVK